MPNWKLLKYCNVVTLVAKSQFAAVPRGIRNGRGFLPGTRPATEPLSLRQIAHSTQNVHKGHYHCYSNTHTTQIIFCFRINPISKSFSKPYSTCAHPHNGQKQTSKPTLQLDGPSLLQCSTPQAAVRWWNESFVKWGVPEAQVSAEYIVGHVLGFKQFHELAGQRSLTLLTQIELDQINRLCNRRKERVPVQYIVGDWDFRDITILVRPPVFIPRPETEMLVDIMLGHYCEDKELSVLEVGCGSGAISVSLLKELPMAHVVAVDCSEEAVQLTKENADRLGVQDRLTVHCAELTSDLPQCLQGFSFNAIVSNPPYIPTQDMDNLAPEITLCEDRRALCGGPDGLNVIQDILSNARHVLKSGGFIWLETDTRHPEGIQDWTQSNPDACIEFVRTFEDYNYKPRFSQLRYQLPAK